MIDFPDTGVVYDLPMSITDQSNSSVHFNLSQVFNRSTRSKYDVKPQPRKFFLVCFFHFLLPRINNHFHETRIG